MDKFPDLLPFAFTVARLFVSEVRQRASDKHAEDASLAILQYLNANPQISSQRSFDSDKRTDLSQHKQQTSNDPSSTNLCQGWNLLMTLDTLASSQNPQIVNLLCDASLPSTLIKCLYLFYDLPNAIKTKGPSESDSKEQDEEQTVNEVYLNTKDLVNNALIKAFTRVLVQLCQYQSAIDELIRKDDLRLVFGIASSQCSIQNRPWRKTAFQTLLTISKNMRDNFLYLEQNACIQVYVDNLNRAISLSLAAYEDIIEMVKVLVEVVYNLDVNNRNQPRRISPIIEQFKSSRTVELIEEVIFKLDDSISQETNQSQTNNDQDPLKCPMSQQPSVSSEFGVCVDDYRRFAKRLIQTLIIMAKIYYSQEAMTKNVSLKPLAMSRFEMLEQFKMPKPSARDCILNNESLRIFKMTWSKCKDFHIIESILDATISLFNDDKYNYFIFEAEQLLVYYLSSPNFIHFPCKLRQKLLKFLEFIVIETNYIPCLELGTLGAILTSKESSDYDRTMVLKTLNACLRYSSKFSDIFRDIGILEVIINLLNDAMQNENSSNKIDNLENLYLLLESSQYLLVGSNNLNCVQFNESGAARHVFNCLSKPKFFHLFIPAHSSSSDDGAPTSRNSTPTPTGFAKTAVHRQLVPLIQANQHLMDQYASRTQAKPSIKQMQKVAFAIMRQLILSNVGDEHLANLLGLLARNIDDLREIEAQDDNNQSGDNSKENKIDMTFLISQEVNLKIYILKTLILILKDSHRCRALFRKVGGFLYIVSAFTAIEKSLPLCDDADEDSLQIHNRWTVVNGRRIWRLIKNALMTIVVALRSEPTNLRVFCDDTMPKFTQAIKRLGCFRSQTSLFQSLHKVAPPRVEKLESYKSIFLSPPARDLSTIADDSISPAEACCQILRFLYDMSLNMADGTAELEQQLNEDSGRLFHVHHGHHSYDTKSLSLDQSTTDLNSGIYRRRSHLQKATPRPPSLDLKSCVSEPAILTFPSIILCILDLIPSCPSEDLMVFACLTIKSLFKHERNQQLLCEAGMIGKLLDPEWQATLTIRGHILHNLSEFMFERLAKQSITPSELRDFLRLGNPLCCKSLDSIEPQQNEMEEQESDQVKLNEKIPTSRIENFINMMTNDRAKIQPPFVEFDMNGTGSSYLFMPSIAPVNAKSLPQNMSHFLNSTLDVHVTEKNGILGGVGSSERTFPPPNGLTFSSWISVQQFPSRSSDPTHNIRLLTIYRGSAATGKEFSCLRVQISALDRALTISTQEVLLFDNEQRPNNQTDPDLFVRVWTPETLFEGRWHHIAIALSKSNQKQGAVFIYIDGQLIHNQRISYINNHVGPANSGPLGAGGSSNACSPAAFVNAFIGSLPQIRAQTRARWKQGPCHLIEECLTSNFVAFIHDLGPSHIGNFQSVHKTSGSSRLESTPNDASSRAIDGQHHSRGQLTHQSASVAPSSPKHAFPLTRVSSSGMNAQGSLRTTSSQQRSTGHSRSFVLSEDRILICLDARSTSHMSLVRMRKIYARFDCRQVTRFLGITAQESSTPLLLLHNTAIHLNGPSRSIGALTIGYDCVRQFIPNPTEQTLFTLGGSYVLIGLIAQSQTAAALAISFEALVNALIDNPKLQTQMENINGFQIITVMLWKKKQLLNKNVLRLLFALVTCDQKMIKETEIKYNLKSIRQIVATRELICECFDLWMQASLINPVLEFMHDLISNPATGQSVAPNSVVVRNKNLKHLRDMDLLPRMLRLLPRDTSCLVDSTSDQSSSFGPSSSQLNSVETSEQTFDTKAIYLIKQTVFELLNRTPRQSDILYFGQFLASLLPSSDKERSEQTISLRNVLLKSLLQMMTQNKQKEVNSAMQEELVRILGFDWFMLYISGAYLNNDTITLGFLNLMIVLSNDELYANFRSGSKNFNGGWLKEPKFPTIDGRFNIQLLGINVGMFLGLGGKGRAVCQDVLDAPNFIILGSCLSELRHMPHMYLMLFQTMMGRFVKLDCSVLESVESFRTLNLDSLCDCLIGETHHKRRQVLSEIQFRCLELVVSLTCMIRDIMCEYDSDQDNQPNIGARSRNESIEEKASENIPTDVIRFFMYLYNNNPEFQKYCRESDEFIDALSETLVSAEREGPKKDDEMQSRRMTRHPAAKQVLELCRLIILDRMTEGSAAEVNDFGTIDQLKAFDRFLGSLFSCKEAQAELIDMLMRQMLLIIDSNSRNNSSQTINNLENIQQFKLLLINSVLVSQIIVDKIWTQEIFADNHIQISNLIEHQLCLAEQIFNFNEILPKSNPAYPFIMQHTLNRLLLYALSRSMVHISGKMFILDLLKKIFDNRTIIILNHMHSPHSAEFFVCMTYCLMRIIEDSTTTPIKRLLATGEQQHYSANASDQQPSSMIERQYGHPTMLVDDTPSSSALMIISMARKVWNAVYQSKRAILSEAFEIPLSLPAFTLETSLDLIQLKPDILNCCEKYWSNLLDYEQKPKRRLVEKTSESNQGSGASSAVNILSGRLTRVVNAASFVSRVVGATAGTMASNVNLVGDRLSQTSRATTARPQRSPSDLSASSLSHRSGAGATSAASNADSPNASGPTSLMNAQSGSQQLGDQSAPVGIGQLDHSKDSRLTKSVIYNALKTHISIINGYIRCQLSQKNHKLALHKYLFDEWLDMEFEILLRERALFGPENGSILEKWCLDLTEGPRRMRKKMVNNTRQFYTNYAYHPEQFNPDNKSLRYRPPMSFDSRLYYLKSLDIDRQMFVDTEDKTLCSRNENVRSNKCSKEDSTDQETKLSEQATDQKAIAESEGSSAFPISSEPIAIGSKKQLKDFRSTSLESISSALRFQPGSPRLGDDADQDDGDSTSFVDFSPEIEAETNSARNSENTDSLSVLRLLEKNELISHMFRCSRVQGLDTYEGLLLFGREHFYLIDGFTLLKTREIKDIDSLPPDAHDPIIPNSTPNLMALSKKTCSKFSYDSVIEVHKRRYLLQPIALEIFSSDGRNALIVFPRNIRNKVHSRLMTVATQITNNAQESLAGQKSNVSVEGGTGLLSNLIGETSVTQRWVRGELSNFQYLMNLNTIAGRSYNDLMQYPIFPWILADYSSDRLDLTKPSTFRDLSRPIGAQTSERLDQFKRRYSEWDDTETPPYHYGTFYSSAMIVASYMVRMEPFTQHFLRLQGGHFDLADRMFHSVKDSWLSASKHNMADIRELIPEFFYLPEFLKNDNKYDLGIKQNGMRLDDVILPPWAKNDAREFIRLHRCALESDYVSAHLHEWIDLIFGYKQQGQPAIEAVNVFHHLFYEGNVDIYNTDIDPIKKNAVIGFINNFGQVPKQLFKKPHPARKASNSSGGLSGAGGIIASGGQIPLTPILPSLTANSIVAASQRVLTHYPQMLRQASTIIKELRGPVGQIVQVDKNIVAVEQNKLLIPPEYCRYIAWGHADRSLRLGLYESEKPIFVWEGSDNLEPYEILCCTIPNNRTMITAGTNSLITVWRIDKARSFAPVSNLYGHVQPITCLASSQAYSLIVSGSRDRTAIIWDLNRLTFVRQIGGAGKGGKPIHQGPISAIAINNSTGDIATCSTSWLHLWSINGELLAQVDTFGIAIQQSLADPNNIASSVSSNLSQLHILSVCFSQYSEWDMDEVILTGSSDGSVAFWSMRYYQSQMSKEEIADAAEKEANRYVDVSAEPAVSSTPDGKAGTVSVEQNGEDTPATGAPKEESQEPDSCEGKSPPTPQRGPGGGASSEPISIARSPRKRTETMNSEWVKLSASSTSTVDNISLNRATPTMPSDFLSSSDFMASGESLSCESLVPKINTLSSSESRNSLERDQQNDSPTATISAKLSQTCTLTEPSAKQEMLAQETENNRNVAKERLSTSETGGNNEISNCSDGKSGNILLAPSDNATLIKFSKSDTSLVDSFVMLGDAGCSNQQQSPSDSLNAERVRPQSSVDSHSNQKRSSSSNRSTKPILNRFDVRNKFVDKLQPNHCWRRELYLRGILPKKRSKHPSPAITCLTISKDHRNLYVGDSSGKINLWTTN